MHTYKTIGFQDLKHGDTYELSVGRYTGTLDNALLPSGSGTLVYKNGITIKGMFERGLLSGPDAEMFVPGLGNFQGLAEHGNFVSGTITYQNGDKYQGAIKQNKPNGKGAFTLANQDMLVGEFLDGVLSGAGTTRKGSTVYHGTYVNGVMAGEMLVLDINTESKRLARFEDGQDVTAQHVQRIAQEAVVEKQRAEINNLIAGDPSKSLESSAEAMQSRLTNLKCKSTEECGKWCYNEHHGKYYEKEVLMLWNKPQGYIEPTDAEREAAKAEREARYRMCDALHNGNGNLQELIAEMKRLESESKHASAAAAESRRELERKKLALEAEQRANRDAYVAAEAERLSRYRAEQALKEAERIAHESQSRPKNDCGTLVFKRACNCPCVTPQ